MKIVGTARLDLGWVQGIGELLEPPGGALHLFVCVSSHLMPFHPGKRWNFFARRHSVDDHGIVAVQVQDDPTDRVADRMTRVRFRDAVPERWLPDPHPDRVPCLSKPVNEDTSDRQVSSPRSERRPSRTIRRRTVPPPWAEAAYGYWSSGGCSARQASKAARNDSAIACSPATVARSRSSTIRCARAIVLNRIARK